MRHRELVLRPTVFAELAPAREALLGQMEAQLEAQREDFEARTGQAMESNGARAQPVSKNMPEVVSQIEPSPAPSPSPSASASASASP